MTQDRYVCLGSLDMYTSMVEVAESDLWLRPAPFPDISKPDGEVPESRVDQVHFCVVSIDYHRPLRAIY